MTAYDRTLGESRLQIVLCSSEADAAAIREAGFKSVRVINDEQALFVSSSRDPDGFEIDPKLSMFTDFLLAFAPGHEGLRDAVAVRLGDTRCRWCVVDAAAGVDEVRNAVIGSRPMWTDEIAAIDDIPEPGQEVLYTTGFPELDRHGLRLVLPSFVTIIGPYASGKSIFLRQLMVQLWRLHGWKSLVSAFEEKVKPRMHRDLRRHLIGKPIERWTDEDVAHADIEMRSAFRFLQRPRRATLDANRLLDRIEFAARVHNCKVIIIDPVNEIDHQIPKGESKTEYLGRFIMALKAMADDYNLLMIVAAHPPKDGVEKRLSKGRMLTLNDGADTSHWGNKSDLGLCLWRPGFDQGPTLMNIDKVKDHESMGRPTLVEFRHNPMLNSFVVNRMGYDIIGDDLQ